MGSSRESSAASVRMSHPPVQAIEGCLSKCVFFDSKADCAPVPHVHLLFREDSLLKAFIMSSLFFSMFFCCISIIDR